MRLYFNTSALNRPFDDLTSPKVRHEAEAVVALMAAVEAGKVEFVSSAYLEFEVDNNPDLERANKVKALIRHAASSTPLSTQVVERARELERFGLRGLDALHIASAEAASVDTLVTTDERMIRRVRNAADDVNTRVTTPIVALHLLYSSEEEHRAH